MFFSDATHVTLFLYPFLYWSHIFSWPTLLVLVALVGQLDCILIGWALDENGKQSGNKSTRNRNWTSSQSLPQYHFCSRWTKSLIRGVVCYARTRRLDWTGLVGGQELVNRHWFQRATQPAIVDYIDHSLAHGGLRKCMNWPSIECSLHLLVPAPFPTLLRPIDELCDWWAEIPSLFCQRKVIDLGTRSIRNRSDRVVVVRGLGNGTGVGTVVFDWVEREEEDDWWVRFACDRTSWLYVLVHPPTSLWA